MLDIHIKSAIDKAVLCWLATVNEHGAPNVSPKEIFTYSDNDYLIVGNLASPNTVSNVRANPKVCLSFVDPFVQKGFKIAGTAKIFAINNHTVANDFNKLQKLAGEHFNVYSLTKIKVEEVAVILAPSYQFYPDITEQEMMEQAHKTYRVRPSDES